MNKIFIFLMFILLCNCSSTPIQDIPPNTPEDTTDSTTPSDEKPTDDESYGTSIYDTNSPVGFATMATPLPEVKAETILLSLRQPNWRMH